MSCRDTGKMNPAMNNEASRTGLQADRRMPVEGRFAGRIAGLVLLLLALFTAALSWPRLQASLLFLPVDTAIGRYFETREIPSTQLPYLVARADAALGRHEHYRYWQGLGLLHYLQAQDEQTASWERQPALRRSLAAGLKVVSRAPVNPYGWLQVAQAQSALGQSSETVIQALEMSLLTGRVEPQLMLPRIELGMRHVDAMTEAQAAQLGDQTALAWRLDAGRFLLALRERRLDLEVVRRVLSRGHGDVLEALEARL